MTILEQQLILICIFSFYIISAIIIIKKHHQVLEDFVPRLFTGDSPLDLTGGRKSADPVWSTVLVKLNFTATDGVQAAETSRGISDGNRRRNSTAFDHVHGDGVQLQRTTCHASIRLPHTRSHSR